MGEDSRILPPILQQNSGDETGTEKSSPADQPPLQQSLKSVIPAAQKQPVASARGQQQKVPQSASKPSGVRGVPNVHDVDESPAFVFDHPQFAQVHSASNVQTTTQPATELSEAKAFHVPDDPQDDRAVEKETVPQQFVEILEGHIQLYMSIVAASCITLALICAMVCCRRCRRSCTLCQCVSVCRRATPKLKSAMTKGKKGPKPASRATGLRRAAGLVVNSVIENVQLTIEGFRIVRDWLRRRGGTKASAGEAPVSSHIPSVAVVPASILETSAAKEFDLSSTLKRPIVESASIGHRANSNSGTNFQKMSIEEAFADVDGGFDITDFNLDGSASSSEVGIESRSLSRSSSLGAGGFGWSDEEMSPVPTRTPSSTATHPATDMALTKQVVVEPRHSANGAGGDEHNDEEWSSFVAFDSDDSLKEIGDISDADLSQWHPEFSGDE